MKALTYEGPRDIAYRDVADPAPQGADAAVVAVRLCGICGSDLHIYGGHGFSPDLGFCVGHEAMGEVVEVGRDVRHFAVGDRVLVPASTGCGDCPACHRGLVARCEKQEAFCYGLSHALEGSQAQAVAVPHADGNLTAVPDEVDDESALLLTDNLPTAWYGARRAGIRPGDRVAVVGLGPVGLLAAMSAMVMGASRVFAIDLVPERRARAAALGAEPVDGDDVKAEVLAATEGRGPEVVLEAVGSDATISLALGLVRPAGRVSVVGVSQTMDFSFPMALAMVKELEFHIGLCSVQAELPALMPLVRAGRLRPADVVTHRLGLSEGAHAYELFASRSDGVGKVVLDPAR
ncbi:MAG TPA: alcohol dehydrogenase family protein [Acidimicrobiales bacterium]|nr:alcohol dehydrogenase family protein [Acidimicrobiales bacterium]